MENVMKNKAVFRLILQVIGLPAAGAFGLWLLTEAPAVHAAICSGGGV